MAGRRLVTGRFRHNVPLVAQAMYLQKGQNEGKSVTLLARTQLEGRDWAQPPIPQHTAAQSRSFVGKISGAPASEKG